MTSASGQTSSHTRSGISLTPGATPATPWPSMAAASTPLIIVP